MKHLKKILIAVLVLAVLVTGIVVTALATDQPVSYTGNYDEALALYNRASWIRDDSSNDPNQDRSNILKQLYTYMVEKPIDPSVAGYDKLVYDYNTLTMRVANNMLNAAIAKTDVAEKSQALAKTYAHIHGAPVLTDGFAGNAEMRASYNEHTLSVAVAMLGSVSDELSYSEQATLLGKINAHIVGAPVLDTSVAGYAEFASAYTVKTLGVASNMLASISATDSAENQSAALAEVHTHLTNAPLYSTDAAGYTEFVAAYSKKTVEVATMLLGAVSAEDDAKTQSETLSAVYVHLDGAPVYDKSVDTYAAFNAACNLKTLDIANLFIASAEETKPEVEAALAELFELLENCDALFFLDAKESDGSFDYEAALLAVDTAEDKTAALKLVHDFLKVTPPSLDAVKAYNLKLDQLTAELSEAFNGETGIFGGFQETVNAMRAHLKECPLDPTALADPTVYDAFTSSTTALDKYEVKCDVYSKLFDAELVKVELINAYITILDAVKNITPVYYSAPKVEEIVGTLEEANALLDAVSASSEIDAQSEALAEVYVYLSTKGLNPDAEGYDAFMTKYSEAALALADAGAALVNGAQTLEDKLATLTGFGEYISEYPLTEYAVSTYNTQLETVLPLVFDKYSTAAESAAETIKALDGYLDDALAFEAEADYASFSARASAISGLDEKAGVLSLLKTAVSGIGSYVNSVNALGSYTKETVDALNATFTEKFGAFAGATARLYKYLADNGITEEGTSTALAIALDHIELAELKGYVLAYSLVYLTDGTSDTNNDGKTDENDVALLDRSIANKKLSFFSNTHTVDQSVKGYTETAIAAYNVSSDFKAIQEAAKTALDDATNLQEYNWNGYAYKLNWDDGKMPLTFVHGDTHKPNNGTGTDGYVIKDEVNGGYYYQIKYGYNTGADGTSPTSGYFEPKITDSSKGVVMEFDLSADEKLERLTMSCVEDGHATKARIGTNFFAISSDTFYAIEDGSTWKRTTTGEKAVIVPGEWTHFTMIYNPLGENGPEMTMYIDYEYAGNWTLNNAKDTYTFTSLRICGGVSGCNVKFDNFDFYQGTNYRNRTKFSSMEDGDKFNFYANYLADESRTPENRKFAFEEAKKLLPYFKDNADYADATAKLEAFDVDAVNKLIIQNNHATITANVSEFTKADGKYFNAELGQIVITTVNSSEAQALVNKVRSFISSNVQFISQADPQYVADMAILSEVEAKLAKTIQLSTFLEAMNRFYRATTLAAKLRHYDAVVQAYIAGEYDVLENRTLAAVDPKVISFEQNLEGLTVFEYYETLENYITVQRYYENSIRVVDCIGFITALPDYEDKEEFWAANSEYINRYIVIIRNIVRSDEYDISYAGIDKAIEKFELIDAYFYKILQNTHLEVFREQLARYPETDSYIEKLGICTFLDNYKRDNDIDETNQELVDLLYILEVYKTELLTFEEKYVDILEENTAYFINTVAEMGAYFKYSELKPLYEEALLYYYGMNVDTDEARAATAKFEEYKAYILKLEDDATMFIGYVNQLKKARNDDAVYKALVKCAAYASTVDEGIAGVSEALKTYEAKLAEYNATSEIIESELSEVSNVVCATRTVSISDAVLAVIKSIFN